MAQGDLKNTLSVAQASATNPTSATGSVAVSVGDLIRVAINQQTQIDTTGVTDNLGHTYAALNAGTDSGNNTGISYWVRVTNAGTLTQIDVANVASSRNIVVCADVFEGPFTSSPLDANPANTQDLTSPISCPATGTLAQANEMVLCWFAPNGNNVLAATSPNLESIELNTATVGELVLGYQKVSSTSSVTPQFTADVNPGNASQGTASFKLATVVTSTAAATMGKLSASAAVERQIDVTTAATMPKFTASAAVERQIDVTATAVMPKFTASAVVEREVESSAAATMGKFTAAASVDVFSGVGSSAAAVMPKFTASAAVERQIDVTVASTMPKFTAGSVVERILTSTAAAIMPGFTAASAVERTVESAAAATMRAFSAASLVDSGGGGGDAGLISRGALFTSQPFIKHYRTF